VIWENIALAFQSLKSNKMRALLTMLGIIIGIMSIIGIMTIGDAMTASVSGELSSLGTNNITLSVQERGTEARMFGGMGPGGHGRSNSNAKQPESDDLITDRMIADMALTFADQLAGISISHGAGSAKAQDGDRYANISITGVNADYGVANNISLLSGSFIAESDVENKSQSAVVSDKFVGNMFPDGENPIGQTVKIYKSRAIELYTIIGVYKHEQMGFGGTASEKDMSTTFYIPVTTAKQDLLEKNYSNITVIGAVGTDVNELTRRLQSHFNRVYLGNDEWQVSASNMTSMLETVESMMSTMSIAIAFIAGISLLVGGIGVMNIMLVSVTERTKEIGTRKALGAQNYHIQLQFVTEAVMVSAVGGVIGLIMGIAVGSFASSMFGATPVISPTTTIGAVLFAMAIGIVFGLYPANKAAKLDPIDALRYE